jgi:hypothetical protein
MAKDKKTTLLEALIKNPAEAASKGDELKKFALDPAKTGASAKAAKQILDDPDGADRAKEFATLEFAVKLALLDMLAEEGAGAFLARLQRDEKDKGVGKAIAKAIHGVRAQGQNVADMRDKKAIKFDFSAEGVPDSYVSALDTEGNRLVLLARLTGAGRLNVFHVVVGDTMGLQNFEGMALTRANYRKFVGMAEAQMGVQLAPIAGEYAAWLIADAAHRSVAAGLPTPPAFEQGKSMIESPASEPEHPLAKLVDRKEVEKGAADYVAKSGEMHTWPECAFWVPDESALEKLAEAVKAADESKVATTDAQRADLKKDAGTKVLLDYFDDAKRTLWEGRLRETAYVLAATGRVDAAKLAWATGITLGKKGSDVQKIPFARELVFKVLEHGGLEKLGAQAGDDAPGMSGEMRAQSEGAVVKT